MRATDREGKKIAEPVAIEPAKNDDDGGNIGIKEKKSIYNKLLISLRVILKIDSHFYLVVGYFIFF